MEAGIGHELNPRLYRYFPLSKQDQAWGLFVTTVGETLSARTCRIRRRVTPRVTHLIGREGGCFMITRWFTFP